MTLLLWTQVYLSIYFQYVFKFQVLNLLHKFNHKYKIFLVYLKLTRKLFKKQFLFEAYQKIKEKL